MIVSQGDVILGGKHNPNRIPKRLPRQQIIKSTLEEIADKVTVSVDAIKTYVYHSNENVYMDSHIACNAMLRQRGWYNRSSLSCWTSCSDPTA